MNKFRYVEKKILCKYDLNEEFFSELGIKVYDMIPLRKVFILFTDKGKKVLKIVNSKIERVEFIDKILEYIQLQYPQVLNYCRNSKGQIITEWREHDYVLLDMIEGREVTFTNPIEVSLCAQAIANMHNSSKGIESILSKEEIDSNLDKGLESEFEKDLDLMKDLKSMVNDFKFKNNFDRLFLENVDKEIDDINKSILLLKSSKYDVIYKNPDKKVLCHNDLAHHNFILDEKTVNIIDFDYCNINTRIIDIYNFTNKVLKTMMYDGEIIKNIVEGYNLVEPLDKDELDILYLLINYPKDFISISKNYYLKQKQWEEEVFESRLKEKISMDYFRGELIKNYYQLIKDI